MFIAIRKEPNGLKYIDKEIYSRTQEVQDEQGNITIQPLFTDEQLSQPPYNYTKVEIDDKYSDCIGADFNEDLTFNVEKYNARKEQDKAIQYENLIVNKIRQKYSINQELAIQRKRYAELEKFDEYNAYVEKCIAEVEKETKDAVNQEQIEESVSEEFEDGIEIRQEQETSVSDCLLSKEEIKMIINDESL